MKNTLLFLFFTLTPSLLSAEVSREFELDCPLEQVALTVGLHPELIRDTMGTEVIKEGKKTISVVIFPEYGLSVVSRKKQSVREEELWYRNSVFLSPSKLIINSTLDDKSKELKSSNFTLRFKSNGEQTKVKALMSVVKSDTNLFLTNVWCRFKLKKLEKAFKDHFNE